MHKLWRYGNAVRLWASNQRSGITRLRLWKLLLYESWYVSLLNLQWLHNLIIVWSECYGGIFQRLSAYASRQNDIWALGVILVNLTCGRNPWKQASPDDETFCAFVYDEEFLPNILPVSFDCNEILKRIFALDPEERITLPELRHAVRRVTRFTMTNEELRRAPEACKAAARAAWSDALKAAKRNPIVVPAIVIEEYSPEPDTSDAASDHHSLEGADRIHTLSFSAGSEHILSSVTGHGQLLPSSTVASIAPYHSSVPEELNAEVHALSVASSGSSAEDSSGPVTPEWNPNADAATGLPDVADEPLVLDGIPAVITRKEPLVKPITDTVNKGNKEVPINSMRGVKELWRKVRF